MKFLILGAGELGYAITFDLIRSPRVDKVVVADCNVEVVQKLKENLADQKIVPVELNVLTEQTDLAELMSNSDVTISCLPSNLNYDLAKLALSVKSNFCELSGDHQEAEKIFLLNDIAKDQGVTIMPDLGLTPGLVSILAVSAADTMDDLYEIKIRTGILPQENDHPLCELGLYPAFAKDRFLEQYTDSVQAIKDGKIYDLPPLSDLEELEFPKPIGKVEAFSTANSFAPLCETYKGRLKHLDYKSIHYPGHSEKIGLLKELGLFSKEKLKLDSGVEVAPIELISELLKNNSFEDKADLVVLEVTVTGVLDEKPIQRIFQSVDYGDSADKLSAKTRMTAYPASIIAQMIARKDITETGVLRQTEVVPARLFLTELDARGIRLTMTERAPVRQD